MVETHRIELGEWALNNILPRNNSHCAEGSAAFKRTRHPATFTFLNKSKNQWNLFAPWMTVHFTEYTTQPKYKRTWSGGFIVFILLLGL